MNDRMLSQDEIEALIASLAGDDEPSATAEQRPNQSAPEVQKPTKSYDFRHPDKFSREHMRTFQVLYGHFCRNFAASLASFLRTGVQLHVTLTEEMTYDEYMRSLANPTLLYVTGMAPLSGQTVVEMNLSVARAILDRLLGSSGLLPPRQMEMTEIELGLLQKVGALLGNSLAEAWHNVIDLEIMVQEPAFAPDFVQVTLPGESTVMIVIEVGLLNVTGTMSMCLPHPMLAPIMEKLTAQSWSTGSSAASAGDKSLNLQGPIGEVEMPIVVELGRRTMSMRELLGLHEGQVIRLDTSAGADLPVQVGRNIKFEGRPGLLGKNIAVEITRPRA
ncbi:MAG: flagellar motor switch protein FliM [Chloroflexota bacterium]